MTQRNEEESRSEWLKDLINKEFGNSTSKAESEESCDSMCSGLPTLIDISLLDEALSNTFERYDFDRNLQNELLSFCTRRYEIVHHNQDTRKSSWDLSLHIGSQIRDVPYPRDPEAFKTHVKNVPRPRHLKNSLGDGYVFSIEWGRLFCYINGKKLAFFITSEEGIYQAIYVYEADIDVKTFNETFPRIFFTEGRAHTEDSEEWFTLDSSSSQEMTLFGTCTVQEVIQAFDAVELYKIYPEGMNPRNYSSRKAMVIQMIDEIILSNEAMIEPQIHTNMNERFLMSHRKLTDPPPYTQNTTHFSSGSLYFPFDR